VTKTLAAALAYLAAGFSVIPLRPGSKLPAFRWSEFQERLPTDAELVRWFEKTSNNVGLVLGSISRGAFAFDFDSPELAQFTFDLERIAGVTFVQRTPRGYHVIFRSEGASIRSTSFHARGLSLDVKGEGGYVVAAPSRLGDSVYTRISPDFRVATIEAGAYEALVERLLTRSPSIGVAPLYSAPPRARQRLLSEWWGP